MNDDIDIFADGPQMPEESGLESLKKLYDKHLELTERIAIETATLTASQEELRELEEVTFPKMFDAVGISEFKVDDIKVSIEQKLYGALPSDPEEREIALKEVEKYGGLSLLKSVIRVDFAKGDDEDARHLLKELQEDGFTVEMKEDINHMTYKAWVKELIDKGLQPDLKALSIFDRRFVKITLPRAKKAKK